MEHTLTPDQIKNLHIEIERNPDRERHLLLDDGHFGWIITKHHNEVFSDAFTDTVRTFREFRGLSSLRNEWAHVQDISLARSRQAAELMKCRSSAIMGRKMATVHRRRSRNDQRYIGTGPAPSAPDKKPDRCQEGQQCRASAIHTAVKPPPDGVGETGVAEAAGVSDTSVVGTGLLV